jgi:hypothetical protein
MEDIDFALDFKIFMTQFNYYGKEITFMSPSSSDDIIDLTEFQALLVEKVLTPNVYIFDTDIPNSDVEEFLYKLFKSNGAKCIKDNGRPVNLSNTYTSELLNSIENITPYVYTDNYLPEQYIPTYEKFYVDFVQNFKLNNIIDDDIFYRLKDLRDTIYQVGIIEYIKKHQYKYLFLHTSIENIKKIIEYLKNE